jgi:hypothetical protein
VVSESNGIKRFTTEESREFEVAGQIFKWRTPYWEEIADVFDQATQAVAQAQAENGDDARPAHTSTKDLIKRIEIFIDPENDGIKRWRAAATSKTNPIPYAVFGDLYSWLLVVGSGRTPTDTPSPSSPGPQAAAATSRGGRS